MQENASVSLLKVYMETIMQLKWRKLEVQLTTNSTFSYSFDIFYSSIEFFCISWGKIVPVFSKFELSLVIEMLANENEHQ